MNYTDQQLLTYAFNMLDEARRFPKTLANTHWLNDNTTFTAIRDRVAELKAPPKEPEPPLTSDIGEAMLWGTHQLATQATHNLAMSMLALAPRGWAIKQGDKFLTPAGYEALIRARDATLSLAKS